MRPTAEFVIGAALACACVLAQPVPLMGVPPCQTIGDLGFAPGRLSFGGDNGIHVTNPWGRSVLTFSASGELIDQFQPSATLVPMGIDTLRDGTVVISDLARGAVDLYDPTHLHTLSLGVGEGEFGIPGDLEVDVHDRIHVVDSQSHEVRMYSSDGTLLRTIGGIGTGPGQFHCPTGIALRPFSGEFFVADHANARVQAFDAQGGFLTEFNGASTPTGSFIRLEGIAADTSGHLFIADGFQDFVQVIDRVDGSHLEQAGQMALEAGLGLSQPTDVDVDWRTCRVYVASHSTAAIEIFDLTNVVPDAATAADDWRLYQ